MRKEKKSGNTNILKEVVIVCLLLLFFFILVAIGRLIIGKINETKTENVDVGVNVGDELNIKYPLVESGEEIEGVDLIEDYELVTEKLRITDFKISREIDRINISGSVENVTDEKIENIRLITRIYNKRNTIIQEISTTIPVINPKEKSPYYFSRPNDNGEAVKIKVEVLKDEDVQNQGTANFDFVNIY